MSQHIDEDRLGRGPSGAGSDMPGGQDRERGAPFYPQHDVEQERSHDAEDHQAANHALLGHNGLTLAQFQAEIRRRENELRILRDQMGLYVDQARHEATRFHHDPHQPPRHQSRETSPALSRRRRRSPSRSPPYSPLGEGQSSSESHSSGAHPKRRHPPDAKPPVKDDGNLKDWVLKQLAGHDARGADQSTHHLARRALDRITSSPFTSNIDRMEPPRRFTPPRFILYDGKTDPVGHIRHYKQAMSLWSFNDALMCKVFPSSLGEVALRWLDKLSPGSIGTWAQLAKTFVARFIANSKQPRSVDALMTMRRRSNESTRNYARRYFETYNEVEECSEQIAVASFKLGLPCEDKLWQSLTKRPTRDIADLMNRIEKYSKVEDETRGPEKEIQKKRRDHISARGDDRRPGKDMRGAVQTIFKIPIFRLLPKIKKMNLILLGHAKWAETPRRGISHYTVLITGTKAIARANAGH